jgi:hypothetical protein
MNLKIVDKEEQQDERGRVFRVRAHDTAGASVGPIDLLLAGRKQSLETESLSQPLRHN